jgi:hypothetical protein
MQQDPGNDSGRYRKGIKSLFSVYGKKEKLFLANLMSDVDEYIKSNPESDYAQITSVFGEPKTVVSQYIADADSAYLSKQIRATKFVKIGVMAFIIAVVIAVASVTAIQYVDHIKAQGQFIDREVVAIVEEE